MPDTVTLLYCLVDDFCHEFAPAYEAPLLSAGLKKRRRSSQLTLAEIMTIVIYFVPHQTGKATPRLQRTAPEVSHDHRLVL